MAKCIFKYVLQDAWENDISEIKIYDKETRNVFCAFVEDKRMFSESFTISKENLEEIKKLFNDELFNIGEIEHPLVLDGVINKFKFKIDDKEKYIMCFNLWASKKEEFKNMPNAKTLYDIFNKISHICIKEGVGDKYFSLDY